IQLDKVPANTPALPLGKVTPHVGEMVIRIGGNPSPVGQLLGNSWLFGSAVSTVRTIGIEDVPVLPAMKGVRIKGKVITIANPTTDIGGLLVDGQGYLVGVSEGKAFWGGAPNLTVSIEI